MTLQEEARAEMDRLSGFDQLRDGVVALAGGLQAGLDLSRPSPPPTFAEMETLAMVARTLVTYSVAVLARAGCPRQIIPDLLEIMVETLMARVATRQQAKTTTPAIDPKVAAEIDQLERMMRDLGVNPDTIN